MIDIYESYPFLPSAREVFTHLKGLSPSEFLSYIFPSFKDEIKDRIIPFFDTAFNNKEEFSEFKFDKGHILFYLFLKILLYCIDNIQITNRIANLYSKTIYEKLKDENFFNFFFLVQDFGYNLITLPTPKEFQIKIDPLNLKNSSYAKVVFSKEIGIGEGEDEKSKFLLYELKKDFPYEKIQTIFMMRYIEYLSLSAKIRDDKRRLVNQAIEGGYIYLSERSIKRLMQEQIRMKILEFSKSLELEEKVILREALFKDITFKEIFEQITNNWLRIKTSYEGFDLKTEEGFAFINFPPCIKHLFTKINEGTNLTHIERLVLVFFLNSINMDVRDICNVFSHLPDFDREKTEYQIKHSREKGYLSYNCSRIKSYGLCPAESYNDLLCIDGYYVKSAQIYKKIKNPLSYLKIIQIRENKKKKKNF